MCEEPSSCRLHLKLLHLSAHLVIKHDEPWAPWLWEQSLNGISHLHRAKRIILAFQRRLSLHFVKCSVINIITDYCTETVTARLLNVCSALASLSSKTKAGLRGRLAEFYFTVPPTHNLVQLYNCLQYSFTGDTGFSFYSDSIMTKFHKNRE